MYYQLKIVLRSLRRQALYTWINIAGLAISLTAAILIMLWVQDEWSYDRFYDDVDNMYLAVDHSFVNGSENYNEYLPAPLARAAQAELAEVGAATAVGFHWDLSYLAYNGTKYFGDFSDYALVDTTFFNVFSMEFVEGDGANPFPDPYAIVITDELAALMFGDEPALGKIIKGNNVREYHVSGVVKSPPKNSLFQVKVLFSFEQSARKDRWGQWTSYTFLRLKPNTDVVSVAQKLTDLHSRHSESFKADFPYILHPLAKYHLYAPDGSETGMKNVRIFTLVAMALLIIACINYVNLVTARARKRGKEISLRKIVGASKANLFTQLMGETFVLFIIAALLSVVAVYLLIPYYNLLTDKQLVLSGSVLLLYLAAFVLVLILAGIYPAIHLASFKPLDIFKHSSVERKSIFSFRRLLVVVQFAFSAALILITIVLNRQQHYMQSKNLGYERENVFAIDIFTNENSRTFYEAFKQELSQHSSIVGVGASQQNILDIGNFGGFSWDGKPADMSFSTAVWGVDRELLPLLNMQLAQGSSFTGTAADSAYLLINEAAAQKMGVSDPVNLSATIDGWGIKGRIVGVVKDFHFRHMSEPISPIVMYLSSGNYWTIYVKTASGKAAEALAATEEVWKKYDNEYPFTYKFLDETFDTVYRNDRHTSQLVNGFALVAIVVSCLGLFGLSTYTAESKTKEIGIRKTLGASVPSIITMLSKEFIVLALISLAIALPLAYMVAERMLQGYVYRISISWLMLLFAAFITLFVALLTVSAQAIKAATANPVKALSTE